MRVISRTFLPRHNTVLCLPKIEWCASSRSLGTEEMDRGYRRLLLSVATLVLLREELSIRQHHVYSTFTTPFHPYMCTMARLHALTSQCPQMHEETAELLAVCLMEMWIFFRIHVLGGNHELGVCWNVGFIRLAGPFCSVSRYGKEGYTRVRGFDLD